MESDATIPDLPTTARAGVVLRAKLRRPALPGGYVSRPRLLHAMDEGERPLVLVVAPAGFGKTLLAADWAARHPNALWLTADGEDGSLDRFWRHLRAALQQADPSLGALVAATMDAPHRPSAATLGKLLADELAEVPGPVRIVLDDFHLVPPGEVHDFLGPLLESSPATLRLLATAREEPPLPLARLRLRGTVREIGVAELLLTEAEVRDLVGHGLPGQPAAASATPGLWQRTGGWPAGVRLALAGAGGDAGGGPAGAPPALDHRLIGLLLEETLAGRSPAERDLLLRASLPDAFNAGLLAAIADPALADPLAAARDVIGFARRADLARPAARHEEGFNAFHPLFRDALRRQLVATHPPETVASLHATLSARWAEAGQPAAAIVHALAAGREAEVAARLAREVQPALGREDWSTLAGWLALLPDPLIREHPELLLARAWVAHLRGQAVLQRELLRQLVERLARDDVPAAARAVAEAEMSLLGMGSLVPVQVDPAGAATVARQAIARIPVERTFAHGVGWGILGVALQASGHPAEAEEALTTWAESTPGRVDSGSVRGLLGLLFVHAQTGNLDRVESVGRFAHELCERHGLRLTLAWTHRFLGDAAYERDDLAGAAAHYAAAAHDAEHGHLVSVREALFGLARAYLAAGRTAEARGALRRAREVVVLAEAVEHLSALDAYDAFLRLNTGGPARALAWAAADRSGPDSATLHLPGHPGLLRAAILAAAGRRRERDEALALLAALRERAAGAGFTAALIRIDALAGVALQRNGDHEAARRCFARSVETGSPLGFARTYLDLVPLFGPELAATGATSILPPAVAAAMTSAPTPSAPAPLATLTRREHEVLAGLNRRWSSKEIGEHLSISPFTVKRHTASIYGKLGVANRAEALRLVRDLGGAPDPPPTDLAGRLA